MHVKIEFVESDHPDLLNLVKELDTFFVERGGETIQKYHKYHDMDSMACAAVAYTEGQPVGCCCWRAIDAVTAEIKRMFVKPEFRKHSIAVRLLKELEAHAAASGCHRAVIETYADMFEAITAYERMGYTRCASFGEFTNDRNIACMEKEISDGTMR